MRFIFFFFFFNDTATTEIYTLSLHDALPIYGVQPGAELRAWLVAVGAFPGAQHRLLERVVGVVQRAEHPVTDRKSTRLNSSHANISYAVFCLKKKKKIRRKIYRR